MSPDPGSFLAAGSILLVMYPSVQVAESMVEDIYIELSRNLSLQPWYQVSLLGEKSLHSTALSI